MTERRTRTLVAASVGAVALTAGIAVTASGALAPDAPPALTPASTDPSATSAPVADAEALGAGFLDDWVDDGRVVRRDQGGDTVSEGQAYGLLLAVALDREDDVDAIWRWTETQLQRPDGLLAWRWQDGAIVDDEPASDADLDAARALVLAGERFDRPDLRADGVALATAVADRLTVETALGRILLPGLWAAAQQPYAYNPSYASPAAFAVLADATGDPRWGEVAAGTSAVTRVLLDATALPPDWAQVHADGRVDAMPGAAGTGDAVRYGYDAARLPVRYAESCSADERALAARLAPTLERSPEPVAQLDLGGGPLTGDRHPLALGARAAALGAAGDRPGAAQDLESAARLSAEVPTYYGIAWTALSVVLLRDGGLGGCPPLDAGSGS